ncbi:hypothetical protein GCM10014719_41270 [Planomonospora parontospora subsp. antibiotica]|nr:hypothetical protein GCM10014719_41270 [Planomonospora parontospora subsp. antibiotica]GII17434.1 hypothetical protein Ppa05_41600 [Planomonospora parontospora subsp. antibiotica]
MDVGGLPLPQFGDDGAHGVAERGERRFPGGARGQFPQHHLMPVDGKGERDVLALLRAAFPAGKLNMAIGV